MPDYQRLRLANVQSLLHLRKEVATDATMTGLAAHRLAELLSDREQ
jgi:hypothetical protein